MLKATTEQLSDPIVLYGIELRNANKRKAENAKDDCGCQQLINMHCKKKTLDNSQQNGLRIGSNICSKMNEDVWQEWFYDDVICM